MKNWASGTWGLAGVVLAASAGIVFSCEIKVRDSAFRTPRDVHRLCVMGNEADESAQQLAEELSAWLEGPGKGLNVELHRVNADDPAVDWSDYAVPSAPPNLPVVAFIGKNNGAGSSFYISHWEPGPGVLELDALKSSPAREAISTRLGDHVAVLLYVPKEGSDKKRSQELLNRVRQKWSKIQKLGISIVEVNRTDEREQILLSFMGLDPPGPDFVGVVFGRGKLMSPLVGSEITDQNLEKLLEQVVEACSCSKPLPSLGVDLPMVWNDALDASFVPISEDDDSETEKDVLTATQAGQGENELLAGNNVPANSAEAKTGLSGSVMAKAAWTVAALAIMVVIGSIGILWWKARRSLHV